VITALSSLFFALHPHIYNKNGMLKLGMAVLTLSTLGPFYAAIDDQPLDHFPTTKAQALLIYLAVERRHHHRREHLMELLWPGMPLESAQVNLRQTLYRLRKTIPEVGHRDGSASGPLLISDRQTVQINLDADLRLDVEEFQEGIVSDPDYAVSLYRGDFLTDFYLVDSSEFESWAEEIRENLRRQLMDTLDQLANTAIQGEDYNQAQNYAWRQLEIDYLRERAYRQLMTALANSGQRNAALAQYQVCRRRLIRELGLEPSHETTMLYEQIQADALKATVEPPATRKQEAGDMPVFMLTDIEGSTRLWDTHRQAMLTALLQHNQILEEQILQHGGRILELRGDGVKAVFEGVNPLQCVLEIQKSLGAADEGEIGDLRIRIGLHGLPTVRKDFDYFIEEEKYYGPVLNHTARIMDAGHGGQILVSETVHNTFALPQGARWHDFGRHEVKSLDQPLQIYGLIHPDLPYQSFPPLRTGSALEKHVRAEPAELTEAIHGKSIRHNLPAQTTPFIGREDELVELQTLIADPEIRLVTIVGPGGMGKTRLALSTAEQILDSTAFPGGVFFIDLTSLDASSEIVSAVADNLNIRLQGQEDRSPLQQLIGALQARKLLLLLDNCEHMLDGIEIVTRMLQGAPKVQVLATSRERLNLSLEQVYLIDGLEFPDWETPEDASEYAAVRLFLQSAHRNQPDFSLRDNSDLTYLARICRLVDGMPLALELAASWVDTLPLSEIAAGIQEGLDFLESELRDLPARHRSLRATIDHSWGKLEEEERTIFTRLSVLRGGFNREAAQEVARANIRQLSRLVNKSFLQYDKNMDRYKVHELLRQYGRSQLEAIPRDESGTLLRRSEYYCAEVERYQRLLMQGQIYTTLGLFKLDSANILTAWDWAVKNDEIQLVDQAIYGIGDYFGFTERFELAREHIQAVLDMLLAATDEIRETILAQHLQAKTLLFLGCFNVWHRHDRASRFFVQASCKIDHLIEEGVDARGEKCRLLLFQGILNQMEGDNSIARSRYLEVVELSKEIGPTTITLRSLYWLGNLSMSTGSPDEAKEWFAEYLSLAKAQKNSRALLTATRCLGTAARELLAYDDAQAYFEKAIELARKNQDRIELSRSLGHKGYIELFLGRFGRAIDDLSQAVTVLKDEFEDTVNTVIYYELTLVIANWLSGDFKQAESAFVKARRFITYDLYTQAASIIFSTELQTMTGQYHQADLQISSLDDLIQNEFVSADLDGRRNMVQGWLALVNEAYAEAHQHFNLSIHHHKKVHNVEWVAWSQAGIAAAFMFQNQWENANQTLRQSLETSIEIKGFIPLLFTLPFACYYLAQEHPDLAGEVYAQIQTSPFLRNAQFFEDTVYRRLPDEIKQSKREEASYPSESELIQNLWEAASKIMVLWETE
jgi:predicted ATPase/DNA-binding SARP family transcriptional activator